ncbi:hypothetical protein BASA61_001867 [Batrachochytrium salamandrivorans]|nr:hypothetical protein BASA61_001867 [Batrachochytrium salamandrivorans]
MWSCVSRSLLQPSDGIASTAVGVVARRLFSNTPTAHYPRMPRKQAPDVTPRFPTAAQLAAPAPQPLQFSRPQRHNYGAGFKPKPLPPNTANRHLTDVETWLPLPTTFSPGQTAESIRCRPTRPDTRLSQAEYPYPYRYFEITLRRGVFGLPKKTKEVIQCLGLHSRHQVVWRLVGPRSTGQILKVKELVNVRLTNTIPELQKLPTGYTKQGSLLKCQPK